MQHVIQPPVAPGPFQGQHVQGFFHHAQHLPVATVVVAYGTRGGIGQVLTLLAEDDVPLDPAHCIGQGKRLILGQPDDEIGEALGAFRADAGELAQLLDQPRQRRSG